MLHSECTTSIFIVTFNFKCTRLIKICVTLHGRIKEAARTLKARLLEMKTLMMCEIEESDRALAAQARSPESWQVPAFLFLLFLPHNI